MEMILTKASLLLVSSMFPLYCLLLITSIAPPVFPD